MIQLHSTTAFTVTGSPPRSATSVLKWYVCCVDNLTLPSNLYPKLFMHPTHLVQNSRWGQYKLRLVNLHTIYPLSIQSRVYGCQVYEFLIRGLRLRLTLGCGGLDGHSNCDDVLGLG